MKSLSLRISLFILFLVLVSAARAQAKPYHWQFAGWYGGGCYPNVEFDPKVQDRVYLVSDVAGVWRSDNLGEKWEFVTNGLENLNVALLVVSPIDSNLLYVGTKRGLFISRDAGQSWQPVGRAASEMAFIRPQGYRSIALSRKSIEKICVGTASGDVFCSSDFGKSWKLLGDIKNPFRDNSPITAMAFSPDENFLYVSSQKGMLKYSFKEQAWFGLKNNPSPVTDFYLSEKTSLTIYVAGTDRLLMSADDGLTWSNSASVSQGRITRVSVDESSDVSMIAVVWEKDWMGGVLLSRDQGKTWQSTDSNFVADKQADPTRLWARNGDRTTALKINPFNPLILFRTDWWGVWRSDDGGQTWNEKIKGAANTVGSDIFVNSKNEVYVATMDDGLLKSLDGGASYKAVFPVKVYDKNLNGHVWRVRSFGVNNANVIATSSPWGMDINQILLSRDGGGNFKVIRDGLPPKRPRVNTMWGQGYPRALAVDPQDPNVIYLGIDGDDGGGLFISTNGGERWARSQGQPGSAMIYNGLAVDPTDTKRIFWGACGKRGGVYCSINKARSWDLVFNKSQSIFDLAIGNDGAIYAAGAAKGPILYSSSDHGKNWELLKNFDQGNAADAVAVDPIDPNRIVVSTVGWDYEAPQAIYMSKDRGRTWVDITGDLPSGAGAAAMAFSPNGEFLYMSRYAGSVYKLRLAENTVEK